MELANVMLALGGDAAHVISKYAVSPAEVAVLQMIHGNDAVTEISVYGRVDRSSRTERERLLQAYGKSDDGGPIRAPAVDALFPGVAARVFEKFVELDLDDSFYKAKGRAAPKKAAQEKVEVVEEIVEPIDEDVVEELDDNAPIDGIDDKTSETENPDDVEDEDGVGDINDSVAGTSKVKSAIAPVKKTASRKTQLKADVLG
jgi:hypothetical protein